MRNCLQSRKVLSTFDLNDTNNNLDNFKTHLSKCPECRLKLDESQKMMELIFKHIPVAKAEKKDQDNLKGEIEELFKDFSISQEDGGSYFQNIMDGKFLVVFDKFPGGIVGRRHSLKSVLKKLLNFLVGRAVDK